MLSQQIKNYNKKFASSSFNFIPKNESTSFKTKNYSIPHNSSKHFSHQNPQHFQSQPRSIYNEHPNTSKQFTSLNEPNIKRAPAPPPPVSQDMPEFEQHEFSGHQRFSSFSQQPNSFEATDVVPRDDNGFSRNGNGKQERPLPPIAFQQLEGHVYRSQKKSVGRKEPSQEKPLKKMNLTKLAKPKPPIPNKGLTNKITVDMGGKGNAIHLQKRNDETFRYNTQQKNISKKVHTKSKEVSELDKINGNCQNLTKFKKPNYRV